MIVAWFLWHLKKTFNNNCCIFFLLLISFQFGVFLDDIFYVIYVNKLAWSPELLSHKHDFYPWHAKWIREVLRLKI